MSYKTNTIQVGSCTVVLHRPELTEDIRKKREENLSNALTRYTTHLASQEAHKEEKVK